MYEDSSANSQFRFSLSSKGGKTDGALTKLAPGHFQAVLPAISSGDYRIDITEERAGQRIAVPAGRLHAGLRSQRRSAAPGIQLPAAGAIG